MNIPRWNMILDVAITALQLCFYY